MIMISEKELLELNDEIEDMEYTYIEKKLFYESEKARMLLETDFAIAIGKAKPTVAEKDAYVKLQCKELESDYKQTGVLIGSLKRKLEILSKMVGDD